MAKAKGKKRKIGAGDVASNRYASYRYELTERIECGIALQGSEVKALRASGAQLKDGYAAIRDGELWLQSVHIPPYLPASRENHDPERPRKLLLHRSQIEGIAGRVSERGLTLVPTRIYFKGPHAKVEIALARGKDLYDKRQTHARARLQARDGTGHQGSDDGARTLRASGELARSSVKSVALGYRLHLMLSRLAGGNQRVGCFEVVRLRVFAELRRVFGKRLGARDELFPVALQIGGRNEFAQFGQRRLLEGGEFGGYAGDVLLSVERLRSRASRSRSCRSRWPCRQFSMRQRLCREPPQPAKPQWSPRA